MAKPFLTIQAIDALVIHVLSFPLDQDMEPSISVPVPRHRQIPKPHPKRRMRIGHTLVANRRARQSHSCAHPPLRDPV